MANTPSAEKAARQAVKRRIDNIAAISKMRTAIRSITLPIDAGDKDKAQAAYTAAVPTIDAMVSKGMIHRNKAARHKSRLAHRISGMA